MKPILASLLKGSPALAATLLASACAGVAGPPPDGNTDWSVVGGDPGSTRYSQLAQIDRSNVARLQVAWEYRSGDARPDDNSKIQCNPIVVDGVLYATTPGLHVFALDAATGRELWRFDPFVGRKAQPDDNRGVVFWGEGAERRIFFSAGYRLYALDAASGVPVPGFGGKGWTDMREGLGRDTAGLTVSATSPGVIYRDLLIMGSRVPEGENGTPGYIRAFDARTGALRWTFRTIPSPGELGYESWGPESWRRSGGANSWAGLSLDLARGIVYAPTGSASFDFFGGDRPGANLFANSLVALDAATGRRIWHYQVVHHDIWDYDLPAAPSLVTLRRDGARVDAVAQITKTGHVFVFDRVTGKPVFPIEERPIPPSELAGEHSWPTQPIPVAPAPFARQVFTEAEVTDVSPAAREHVLARLRQARQGRLYTPLGLKEMVVVPGMNGGGEWGGAAVDPDGVLYVNGNELPYITRMWEKDALPPAGSTTGQVAYTASCAGCHGADRRGDGDRFPSLLGLKDRRSVEEVRAIIEQGRGLMPPFAALPSDEKRALVAYLMDLPQGAPAPASGAPTAASAGSSPYRFGGYTRFSDPEGYPAIKPPWGTLNAIDLNTGEYLWRVPLGEYAELTARGIPPTGTTNYGGPVVTAGGLVFIAATADSKIRAFDRRTGAVLWEAPLPTSGFATPATYRVNGRQYVVIAAGGGRLRSKSGDSYVAFALPE